MNASKTLLVIDDSEVDRLLLSKTLTTKFQCRVLQAANAVEAFKILESEAVDMILLDVEMPNMTGDEMVVRIRQKRAPEELPIIMVSGNHQASVVVKCLRAGANDYIDKPVNLEVAVTRILNHLRLANAIQLKVQVKQLAAVNAMITTYHHEINNPLTIAKMELYRLKKAFPENPAAVALEKALDRIAQVVQKIQEMKLQKAVNFENYSGEENMVKVHKVE